MEAAIEFRKVSKRLGDNSVINDLDLSVPLNAVTALVGESGSGKTTCLRLMNGLIRPDHGWVYIMNEPFPYDTATRHRRGMGYCQQGSGMFPHLNVAENLGLVAARIGWSKAQIKNRALELLALVNLPATVEFLRTKPQHVSGGQRQRLAIARALFLKPKVLLMDEPFGALDPVTRFEIQDFFMDLQSRQKLTVVLVTHDLNEAVKMSDYIVLLNQGRLEQFDSPQNMLAHPQTDFARDFFDSLRTLKKGTP